MKSRTFAGWLLAGGLTTLLLCAACSSQGDAGQGCVYSGSLLSGSYSCNGGLVCNTGRSSPTCESPSANAVGGPCGQDNNCKAGLWCNLKACADLIGLGQPCPSGVGCASGLNCSKMVDPNRPVCSSSGGASADAGSGLPGTDASDMDATQTGDGGSSSDASSSSSCPGYQSLAECLVAPGGLCVVSDAPLSGCAPNALPSGLGCSGQEQCAMEILPCPGEVQSWDGAGRVDGYICSCVGGRWSCDNCYLGRALCADSGPPGDGAAGGGVDGGLNPDGGFATVIRLGSNDLCLPTVLPTNSSGMTTCAIVVTGLPGGCTGAGLSPATPEEIATIIGRRGLYPPGSACELKQLARSAGTGPGCNDPQSTGWCYVQGSCLGDAGSCQQDICTTATFNDGYFPANWDSGTVSISWGAYLVCP
jgi:hypothetical protein